MFFPRTLCLVTRSGGRSSVVPGAGGEPGLMVDREGESQEVRGTSQPAWESGHGDRGGEYYILEDQGNIGRL